jgi:hypothetical protein
MPLAMRSRRSFVFVALVAGSLGLAILAPASATSPISPGSAHEKVLQIDGIPSAREMMMIVEGTPFVVPQGKILVITGAGVQRYQSFGRKIIEVRFDGQMVLAPSIDSEKTGVVDFPAGLAAHTGTTVTTFDSGELEANTVATLFGYLTTR